MAQFKKEDCQVCSKAVYPAERVSADELVFHKGCFRCKQCNNTLKLGSYASMNHVFYCKPCFKKLFFSKGNYSEGFGLLKPQHEFNAARGLAVPGTNSGDEQSAAVAPAAGGKERAEEAKKDEPVKEESPKPVAKKDEPAKEDSPKPMAQQARERFAALGQQQQQSAASSSSGSLTPPSERPAAAHPTTVARGSSFSRGVQGAAAAEAGAGGAARSNKCQVCSKTVYKMEEVVADDKVFHKSCFRCKQCTSILKLGSFASMNAVYYCKPCFKKMFLSKGNYSEGFGTLKPQQAWAAAGGQKADGSGPDARSTLSDSAGATEDTGASEAAAAEDKAKQQQQQQQQQEEEAAAAAAAAAEKKAREAAEAQQQAKEEASRKAREQEEEKEKAAANRRAVEQAAARRKAEEDEEAATAAAAQREAAEHEAARQQAAADEEVRRSSRVLQSFLATEPDSKSTTDAADRISDLEAANGRLTARVAELEAELAEKTRTYEQRITELEQRLNSRTAADADTLNGTTAAVDRADEEHDHEPSKFEDEASPEETGPHEDE